MTETMPQNSAEAAYVAFAMVDELVNLLVSTKILNEVGVGRLFESVAKRLIKENNFDSQRAAKFVANRMSGKE